MQTQLRAMREESGLSQTAFAARVGISVATYGPIERGLNQPSSRVAELLFAAFGKPADVLLSVSER